MGKRTINRRELREQADAAEKRGLTAGADKKKTKATKEPKKKAAPKPKRSKTKAIVRKRLVWVIYSGSLKEEGRFPYAEREQAETRAEELMQKHKRTYFVQGLKEPLADKEPAAQAAG